MVKTEVEIVVNTTNATKSIDEVGSAVDDAAGKFENLSAGAEGATAVIDEATGGLATRVKNVGQGLISMGKSAVTSFRAAIAGANGMKAALISTGIGAIVVALGTIAAYWEDIVGFVSGASEEQLDLLERTEATRDATQETLTALEGSENILKLQGKSEREIRDLKIQQTDEVIAATKAVLEQEKVLRQSQIDAAKRNQEYLSYGIQFVMFGITSILAVIDAASEGLVALGIIEEGLTTRRDASEYVASFVFDPEAVAEEADATIKETEEALLKLQNQRAGYIVSNQQQDQAAADQAAADAKAAREAEEAEAKAHAEKMLAIRQAQEAEEAAQLEAMSEALDEVYQKQLSAQDQELNAIREKYFQLEEFYKDDADAAAAIEEQKQKDIQAIQDKYREEERKKDAALQQAKVKLATDSLSVLNSLAQAALEGNDKRAKTAFRIGKALSLSQAVINTAQAVSAALAQTTDVTPTQSLRFANAALAGAQGLAQILTISKQQFNPSGGAGGGAASVPRPSAFRPTMSFEPQGLNSGIGLNESPNLGNQIAESLSGSPIKAYVVSQEVQTQAKMNRKIRETATIG